MTDLNQTVVTDRHAQFSENDTDVSALLPRNKNMFVGHFAETAQLDKKQRMPTEHLSFLSDDVATLTSMVIDDVISIREGSQDTVVVNITPYKRPPNFDAAEKANLIRGELLARKYAEKESFSKEDSARFAIVTERIRQLLPSVTMKDFESLEQVLHSVRKIESADIAAREKLGILPKKI